MHASVSQFFGRKFIFTLREKLISLRREIKLNSRENTLNRKYLIKGKKKKLKNITMGQTFK